MPFDGVTLPAEIQLLVRARDLLSRRGGWMQHDAINFRRSSTCLMGAIYLANSWDEPFGVRPTRSPVVRRALARIHKVIGIDIVDWNDTPGRKKKEVLKVLDRAIG